MGVCRDGSKIEGSNAINHIRKSSRASESVSFGPTSIFRPLSVQTKCTLHPVHIPMLNNENLVHRVSNFLLLLKIFTPLFTILYITAALVSLLGFVHHISRNFS